MVGSGGLRSFFLHQPAVCDAYARPAHIGLPYSPLHDHKTLANTRNGRSYYVNASPQTRRPRSRANPSHRPPRVHDRLWGRSRWLRISPAHGASVETQGAELQPRGPPPTASSRRPAAAPETRSTEAREGARGTASRPIRTASGGDPGGYAYLRLAAHP